MRDLLIKTGLVLVLLGISCFILFVILLTFAPRTFLSVLDTATIGYMLVFGGVFFLFVGRSIKENQKIIQYVPSPQDPNQTIRVVTVKEKKNPIVVLLEICAAIAGIIGVIIAYLQFKK
jgi:hypothetical protein